MKSNISRIKNNNFWTFHGGIHPPEQKFLTSGKPIRSLPLPTEIILPLQQHIGQAGELLVKVGDEVLKGQALTQYTHAMTLPIHAPTSGKVTAIKNAVIAHPSGMLEPCVFITPDGKDAGIPRTICSDYSVLSNEDIINKISRAGISGMGGAGFPTHIKVNAPSDIETLIINAAECEPYITADDLLIREQTPTIIDGINILCQLLKPQQVLIGIEDNKPEAIKALQAASNENPLIQVCVLPTKYPTGGEKQLIQCLTGQEVPKGSLPSKIGIVMQNIATCFAIAEAVIHDTPLIRRVVTISGTALKNPQNVWALIGTPVEYLLTHCGYPNTEKKHIIMGGPMMGYSLPSGKVPVIKTTNCILAPSEAEIPSAMYQKNNEVECIRCGQCADVCPSQLLPQELQWSAKAKDHNQLEKLNLFDCIECGACAYVCPSQIPLVHYYRIGKAEIRQQKVLDLQAEKAKLRFEARKVRLENEKKAREEKHKKAAEARKARMSADTPEAKSETSAVAAALARVKAKKMQGAAPSSSAAPSEDSTPKSAVAAAIARAKAKKLAAQTQTTDENANAVTEKTLNSSPQTPAQTTEAVAAPDDKKAKIAEAIARAKAKKAEKMANTNSASVNDDDASAAAHEPTAEVNSAADDKKAKIAAAIAKAKAKKAEKMASTNSASLNDDDASAAAHEPTAEVNSAADDKKAKIAAAIAKAKAKKAEKMANTNSASVSDDDASAAAHEPTAEVNSAADDKKAKIAAAIAKAKAKKLQQTESL